VEGDQADLGAGGGGKFVEELDEHRGRGRPVKRGKHPKKSSK
jgi:hypothetical protein